MPSTVYEPIMNALLALLQAKCAVANGGLFPTISRRFMMWEALIQNIQQGTSPFLQPALFLFDGVGLGGGHQRIDRSGRGLPGIVTLTRTIVVYAQTPGGGSPGGPDATTAGGTVFAPLQENIEAAFVPDTTGEGNVVTLGGLVSHCWIEGEGHWITPDIDPNGQGMFTVPVNIKFPYLPAIGG